MATHMLLYLNMQSFDGEAGKQLADELRLLSKHPQLRSRTVRVLLVHEARVEMGGCNFERFFYVTPPDLAQGDLYKNLAVSLHPSYRHLAEAVSQLLLQMGATVSRAHTQELTPLLAVSEYPI